MKKLGLFTWNGFENFGDDLINFAVTQLFNDYDLLHLSERKCLSQVKYRLRAQPNRLISRQIPENTPLIVCGGGMIASDVSSSTLTRWAMHLATHKGLKYTFGIGVGPFSPGTEKLAHSLLEQFESPILVRTVRDFEILWGLGIEGSLACDPSLIVNLSELISRNSSREARSHDFYPWRGHWLNLEEEDYHELMCAWFNESPKSHKVEYRYSYMAKLFKPKEKTIEHALIRYINLIANSQSVATSKLHTSIIAGLLEVPQTCIPYGHKFDLLLELGINASTHGAMNFDQKFSPDLLDQVKLRGNMALKILKERINMEYV